MPRTILLLSSMPRDMAPLRVHEEVRAIQEAINRTRYRDEYQVVVHLGARARDMHRVLMEHRPAIVHFSGHGRGEQGVVVLEDERGDSLPVSGSDLARMLGHFQHEIECVLINSCQSEAQIDIIAERIPFVIGMKQALDDRAAICFAVAFYEGLLHGESIPRACDIACSAVSLNGLASDRIAVLALGRHGPARQPSPSIRNERPGYAEHTQDAARPWEVIAGTNAVPDTAPEALPTPSRAGRLWEVPELPPHYLARVTDIEQLERALMEPYGNAVGITAVNQSRLPGGDKHGLYGMGGIGKSVLAAAIARRPAIRERFPDGVFWITLGQTPQLSLLQAQLCRALGYSEYFDDISEGTQWLREIVADRAILLVLDDVWDAAYAQALDVVGRDGRLLVTTRDVEVLTWLDAREHCIDVLDPTQALALLADWMHVAREALPPTAADVARVCGYLPLALAMLGALMRRGRVWAEVQSWLNDAQIVRIQGKVPAYPYRNLLQAVDASVTALASEHSHGRRCYIDMAVFPEDVPIPRSALHVLWSRYGLHTGEADAFADTLCDRALARRDEADSLLLHALQRFYTRSQVKTLTALHGTFVDAYRTHCRRINTANCEGPYAGLNDRYFFQRLPWHLAEAERFDELADLLFDFDWIDAKLRVAGVTELLADFEFLPGEHAACHEVRFVRDALRMSIPVLAGDPSQLPSQLVGRLGRLDHARPGGNHGIARLLDHTRRTARYPWLRPMVSNLTAPGSPEILTLDHGSPVEAVAVTPDGKRAISSGGRTLKLWDLNAGSVIFTIDCVALAVTFTIDCVALAVTPDGKRAVSASRGGAFTVWDIETGSVILDPGYQRSGVCALAMTPDGNRAVIALEDRKLELWVPDAGCKFRTFARCISPVTAVAVTPDGKRAVSASDDGTLKLWDLDAGAELVTLAGHDSPVLVVAVTPDGKRIVSASEDKTIKLWDLDVGSEILTIKGPNSPFMVKAMTPDSKCAISALRNGNLRFWDLDSGSTILTLEGHAKCVNAVAVTSDGKRAISASDDGILKLWDLDSRCESLPLKGHASCVRAIAVTPDGKRTVSASKDRTLKLWDSASGSELLTLEGHDSDVRVVAVTPDGKRAVSASVDRTLKLWDLESGSELLTLEGHTLDVLAVAVTPDGRRAVSASADRTLKLWDLESGSELLTLEGHWHWVKAVAVTPDSRRVVSASYDQTIRLWDLDSGSEIVSLPMHSLAIAVSADGRRFLSALRGEICKLWNLDEGFEIFTFASGSGCSAVAVNVDGKRNIYASGGQSLELRDVDSDRLLATFSGHGPVTACAVSSNEDLFVAGDTLGRIHFLELIEAGDATATINAHVMQAEARNAAARAAPMPRDLLSPRSTGLSGSLRGAPLLTQSERNQLVVLLEACRALKWLIGDDEANERYHFAIETPVEHAPRLRRYLSNVVDTCNAVPDGLAALREAVFWLEGNTIPMQQVDAYLQRLGINLSSLS